MRIEQTKADIAAHENAAKDQAEQAAGRAQSQWKSMQADAAAKMQDLQDRIARKRDQHDVKVAEEDAEAAEEDAADALDYASWAIDQANLAVLDAPGPTRGRRRRHRREADGEPMVTVHAAAVASCARA